MAQQSPKPDLSRLVAHVALNDTGWWKDAIERLVLASAYTVGPSPRRDVLDMVEESCGAAANSDQVVATLERLIAAGSLVEMDDSLRVAEEVGAALSSHEQEVLDEETALRGRFELMAATHDLADRSDELWRVLETDVVLPIVAHMGARLYGLLARTQSNGNGDLETVMSSFTDQWGSDARQLFVDFLDPTDDATRRFVLRRLNAQYALDAAALPSETLDTLAQIESKPERVDIFLDTNFLLSILGLHDNPGDDVAKELLALVGDLRERVNLRLYVLPITIEETRRVLRDVIHRLSGFRGQANLAEAARRSTSHGLTARYLAEASKSEGSLTAEDFFGPYESDLVTVLRSRSVELFNADLDELRVDQKVIDDIHDQVEVQERFRTKGAKPYDANLHDMVLWHFVERRRTSAVESPLQVTGWIATLDYGLMSFDRHKRAGGSAIPVCLQPPSLIQLFQFWIPASSHLDEALVGSIRQPLLFLNFDVASEQVTLRILNQLSRFESAGDLSPELAAEILTNTALRDRLAAAASADADEDLIHSEVLEKVRELDARSSKLREARDHAEERASVLEAELAHAEKLKSELEIERQERADLQSELSDASAAAKLAEERSERERGDLERRLEELEAGNRELVDAIDERARETQDKWRLGSFAATALLVGSTIAVGGATLMGRWITPAWAWSASISLALLVLLLLLERGVSPTRFAQRPGFSWLQKARTGWWALVLAVLASLIAGFLLEQDVTPPAEEEQESASDSSG